MKIMSKKAVWLTSILLGMVFSLFLATGITSEANYNGEINIEDCNKGDIAVINGMISKNSLAYGINDVKNWDFIQWSADSANKRIVGIAFNGFGDTFRKMGYDSFVAPYGYHEVTALKGHIDVSKLERLRFLDLFYGRKITKLTLGNLKELELLACAETGIKTLDVSKTPNLRYILNFDMMEGAKGTQIASYIGLNKLSRLEYFESNDKVAKYDLSKCKKIKSDRDRYTEFGGQKLKEVKLPGGKKISINNKSKNGIYIWVEKVGKKVVISANGKNFKRWEAKGIKLSSKQAKQQDITIKWPKKDITLTPIYK
jgi:hypothetical protein